MILKNPAERPKFANFFDELTACFGDFDQFQQNIEQIAEIAGIDLSQFEIDHLAVRMNNNETAQAWRTMLVSESKLLKESEVNGRPIGLFQLKQPVNFCKQSVSIIELPFPKGKTYPQEGWEHIEIVMPFLESETVEQWTNRICEQYQLAQNSALKIKVSQPSVEGERLPNPSIAISLRDGTNQNYCCLKVHPYDINAIICSEI